MLNFFIPPIKSEAFFGHFFGGKIESIDSCTCSEGEKYVTIKGSFGGTFIYDSAKLYRHNHVEEGKMSIGSYKKGVGVCEIGEEPYCDTVDTDGTISSIATS